MWQPILAVGMALRATKGDENPRFEVAESRLHLMGVRAGGFSTVQASFQPHARSPSPGIPNQLVGRTPWSARDALVPLVHEESVGRNTEEPTRGSAADEGVRPTLGAIARKRGKLGALGFSPPRRSSTCHRHVRW